MAVPLEHLVPHLVATALQIMEDEEEDNEAMVLQIARIAAAEIMELEEGEGLGQCTMNLFLLREQAYMYCHLCLFVIMATLFTVDLVGEAWVPVTVIIDEYHRMGDPCFQRHFRMSRGTFEVK